MLCFIWLASMYQQAHISQISNYPDFSYPHLRCGMLGGCRLYIKGSGFDLGYDNQVIVGPYTCQIDNYYTSEELIVCEMPKMLYGVQTNLQVLMKVRDQLVECKYHDCNMNFEADKTPMIWHMYPQALFAGDDVTIEGYFRTKEHSGIKDIRISGQNCERTEEQMEGEFASGSYGIFPCKVPEDMEIGDHTLSLTGDISTGFDNPLRGALGFTVGTNPETYNLRVHPKILKISSNSGYLNGQLLEIIGIGFGLDKSKIQVSLEDVDCQILFVEPHQERDGEDNVKNYQKITCSLESRNGDFTNKMFKGVAGLRNQVYNVRDHNLTSMRGDPESELLLDQTILVMENKLNRDNYTQRI